MTLMMRDQDNLERGREEGLKQGREEGIKLMAATVRKYGIPQEELRKIIQEKYNLTEEEAEQYLE